MDAPQPAPMSTIETLPPEISQRFLALCDPVDVSNFAQTSTASRALVYESYDQVIWRELFLELFDDPRPQIDDDFVWSRDSEINYWQIHLMERIRTRQHLRSLERKLAVAVTDKDGYSDAADFCDFVDPDKLVQAVETLVHTLDTAKGTPRAVDEDDESFASKNIAFVASLLSNPWVQEIVFNCTPSNARQLSARLHVYSGACLSDDGVRKRGKARERVYQLARYTPKNRWGPYLNDFSRRPDWEQLESMMQVVWKNVDERQAEWHLDAVDVPAFGFDQMRSHTLRTGPTGSQAYEGDWAGVQGKWYRVVCFMDYRDLWAYNFGGVLNYNADFLCTYQEAVRLMSFDLEIVSIGEPPDEPSFPIRGARIRTPPLIKQMTTAPENRRYLAKAGTSAERALIRPVPRSLYSRIHSRSSSLSSNASSSSASSLLSLSPSSPSLFSPISAMSFDSESPSAAKKADSHPTIYFKGVVKSSDIWHPTSYVHGRVERTAAGDVVWKLTSNYDGQDRWVSEGVQLGGVQSRVGVLGVWSDAQHEHEGPAGPFWFWKAASN